MKLSRRQSWIAIFTATLITTISVLTTGIMSFVNLFNSNPTISNIEHKDLEYNIGNINLAASVQNEILDIFIQYPYDSSLTKLEQPLSTSVIKISTKSEEKATITIKDYYDIDIEPDSFTAKQIVWYREINKNQALCRITVNMNNINFRDKVYIKLERNGQVTSFTYFEGNIQSSSEAD